jgi:hypothetical protein
MPLFLPGVLFGHHSAREKRLLCAHSCLIVASLLQRTIVATVACSGRGNRDRRGRGGGTAPLQTLTPDVPSFLIFLAFFPKDFQKCVFFGRFQKK